MYKQRKIYKQITHAREYLIRGGPGDKEMAINLLGQALKDHEKAIRKSDKKKGEK